MKSYFPTMITAFFIFALACIFIGIGIVLLSPPSAQSLFNVGVLLCLLSFALMFVGVLISMLIKRN